MCVAEPPAKLTWYLPNGDPLLHNGDNIVFDTSEKNRASLMLKNVSRDMSGMFRGGVELATNIHEAMLTNKIDPDLCQVCGEELQRRGRARGEGGHPGAPRQAQRSRPGLQGSKTNKYF